MEPRVLIVMSLVEAQLDRDIPLETIARQVNLSVSRLRHIFKSETGLTLKQYCTARRLQEAKKLIEGTFLNIKEIMARVGIRDKNQFTRSFKRTYGLTPVEYRLRHLGRTPVLSPPTTERDNESVRSRLAAPGNKLVSES